MVSVTHQCNTLYRFSVLGICGLTYRMCNYCHVRDGAPNTPLPMRRLVPRRASCGHQVPRLVHLDQAVQQVRPVLHVDIHVCEQLAKSVKDLVEVCQDVASRHLSVTPNASARKNHNRYGYHSSSIRGKQFVSESCKTNQPIASPIPSPSFVARLQTSMVINQLIFLQ